MKVPRIKFDSLHYIRFAVCAFQPLVSVRYRTKHQYHHSSEINSTPVPIVDTESSHLEMPNKFWAIHYIPNDYA
jgi:hypothetical protein